MTDAQVNAFTARVNVELGTFGAFVLLDILHAARPKWAETNQANVVDHLVERVVDGLVRAGLVAKPEKASDDWPQT